MAQTSQEYFNRNPGTSGDKLWVEREEGLRDISELRFRFALQAHTTAITTLQSGTFAIDSTGVKTVTTAHNLLITPEIYNVQVSVTENTDVDDWAFDLLKIESVDATNVVCKINVSTASGTAAATARLAILVITGD